MSDTETELSIIIPVYNRVEYFNDALKSLLRLKGNEKIEILIITNIDLPNALNDEVIKIIKSEIKSLSGKLVLGIKMSSGGTIAFLEDDDLWCNNKISKIISVFKNNRDIDFYHNGFRQFRNEITNSKAESLERSHFVVNQNSLKNKNSDKIIRLLIKNNIGYNLSSMAARKNLLLENLEVLESLSVFGIDTLVSIIAIVYSKNIYIDNNIRTYIRIHKNNSYKEMLNANGESVHELTLIRKMENSSAKSVKKYIDLYLTIIDIIEYCKRANVKRHKLLFYLIKYIKYCLKLGILPAIYVLGSIFSRIVGLRFYNYILQKYHTIPINN